MQIKNRVKIVESEIVRLNELMKPLHRAEHIFSLLNCDQKKNWSRKLKFGKICRENYTATYSPETHSFH